jgi:hypothetical protein
MKKETKILVCLFVAALFLLPPASIFGGATTAEEKVNDENGTQPSEENNDKDDFTHTVLGEYGTTTWCPHCPPVSGYLYTIYSSGDYDFYYVSLVCDKNNKAHNRFSELGGTGYPTVWFDGGYRVLVGNYGSITPYINAINFCGARSVADLDLNVNVIWEGDAKINVSINIKNNESEEYEGHLRAYIVEPTSRWNDYSGNPYHFGFLDYAFNQDISIESGGTFNASAAWNGSEHGYPDITEDNIMVISAVFDSDTHYVDQTAAAKPGEDTIPPEVSIEKPRQGYLYIFNKEIMSLPWTIIIGKLTVVVNATDDTEMDRVEFYVDGSPVATDKQEPYAWDWDITSIFQRYALQVVAYDKAGNSASAEIKLVVFYLGIV